MRWHSILHERLIPVNRRHRTFSRAPLIRTFHAHFTRRGGLRLCVVMASNLKTFSSFRIDSPTSQTVLRYGETLLLNWTFVGGQTYMQRYIHLRQNNRQVVLLEGTSIPITIRALQSLAGSNFHQKRRTSSRSGAERLSGMNGRASGILQVAV